MERVASETWKVSNTALPISNKVYCTKKRSGCQCFATCYQGTSLCPVHQTITEPLCIKLTNGERIHNEFTKQIPQCSILAWYEQFTRNKQLNFRNQVFNTVTMFTLQVRLYKVSIVDCLVFVI